MSLVARPHRSNAPLALIAMGVAILAPDTAPAMPSAGAASRLEVVAIEPATRRVTVRLDAGAQPTGETLRLVVERPYQVESARIVDADLVPIAASAAGQPLPEIAAAARIAGQSLLRDRRLVEIAIAPVVRGPDGIARVAAMTLELRGVLDPDAGGLRLQRTGLPWEAKLDRALGAVAVDLQHAERPMPPQASGDAFAPTFRPTTDGSPVEYVIVTAANLAGEFERLADWKTRKGVQAVVRTTDWIASTYPNGVDRAEQIRFFLRDAYSYWGTLYVLIGGDTDVVPIRYATSRVTTPPASIPTDLYYGCLEGNWNGDHDQRFGEGIGSEPGDDADLGPELFVGRAPVSTAAEAQDFVDKLITYEQAPPVDDRFPGSILLLGEQLTPLLDGAELCEETLALMPSYLRAVRMYENHQNYPGAVPETQDAVLDSLDAGFGAVLHVGHGFRNTMSVGFGSLSNASIDALENGPRQGVVFAINCSSAAVDFNCIGERFVKNPQGGAVAYIGSSRLASIGAAQDFQNEFFQLVFNDTLTAAGEALATSKLPFLAAAQGDNLVRWMTFAMLLLGDPEMPVWHRQPAPLAATHAPEVELGLPAFAVEAASQGSPVPGARVAMWLEDDAFATALTDPLGQASLAFPPTQLGDASLTLSKPGYLPYTATLPVVGTTDPYLHVLSVAVDDDTSGASSGNGDGNLDAGETVELAVTLENAGGAAATGIAGLLSNPGGEPALTIVEGSASYGTIGAGGQSLGNDRFVITVASSAPPGLQPTFELALSSDGGSWTDVFVLPVLGVELEHHSHVIGDPLPGGNANGLPEPGEAIDYAVTLRNNGAGVASAVSGTARILDRGTGQPATGVLLSDATMTFGDLAPGALVTGDPIAFELGSEVVIEDLLIELTWSDGYGVRAVELSDLVFPGPPANLEASGSRSSIRLRWDAPIDADVKGYDVFRSDHPFSGFERVNAFTADGSTVFEDPGLPALTRFYYYVTARDSSFNASVPSPLISAATNPPLKTGWPIQTAQETPAGVVVDDVDGDPGMLELVTGSDAIYVWHADGTELRDGDGDPITSGVFTADGRDGTFGFHATPAIADIDLDGELEIIGVAWKQAKVYVWGPDATPEPGWPQTIGGDFNWASPAVDDLDFDGDLEIVAVSGLQGIVYAWHHDGTELVDGDANPATHGVVFDSPTNYLYASPAIGNLSGGLSREFVVASNHPDGMVYAFDAMGEMLPNWPFLAGGQVTSSPALVDLDGDGHDEAVIAAEDDSVYVLHGDATVMTGWPQPAATSSDFGHTSSVAIADLDQDGELELVYAQSNGTMFVRDGGGNVLPGWEAVTFAPTALSAGASQCTPTVADIDGDGYQEVVLGAEDGLVYGWNHDGSEAAGFPIAVAGEIRGAATLWDVDQDGLMELSLASTDRSVYVWDFEGELRGDRVDWPFFRHDTRNTGRFDAELTAIGIAEPLASPTPTPSLLRLWPAAPNPLNPATTIRFDLPGQTGGARRVRLAVYDAHGRLVRELVDGAVETGPVAIRWDGRNQQGRVLASGTYFIRLEALGQVRTQKAVILK